MNTQRTKASLGGSLIRTVTRPVGQYALMCLVGALFVFAFAMFVSPDITDGVKHLASEVGRMMLGLSRK